MRTLQERASGHRSLDDHSDLARRRHSLSSREADMVAAAFAVVPFVVPIRVESISENSNRIDMRENT